MLVVSNTSPLTNLARIGCFDLLRSLFEEIHIADGVWKELNTGGRPHPGSREVESARWVQRHEVSNRPLTQILLRDLDSGETETLALAVELRADLVLLDEKAGRQAARRLGLDSLGVLGILLQSKQENLIEQVRPLLDALRREAGFYVADELYRRVLTLAQE